MVMWFLNAKNVEYNRQIVEVYCEGAVTGRNVQKWCQLFKEGRTTVPDEWSEHLCLVMDDLKEKVKAKIWENRQFTIYLPQENFGWSESEEWPWHKSCSGLVEKLGTDFFDEGIQKQVPWYDKCLNVHGDYEEK